jgi:hypothetical protein
MEIEYDYVYFDTLKLDHIDPKQPMVLENQSLDFSFCDITDVISLKKKEPRAGKRLPIHDSENEDEKSNEKQVKLQAAAGQLEDNKNQEEKVQKKEKDEVIIPSVVTLLQQNNIPLINNNDRITRMGNMDLVQLGGAGKKGEEGKAEGSRKKVSKKV